MSAGEWIGLMGVAATVLIAVVASWFTLSNKLTRVETLLDGLNKGADENRADHQRIWKTLDDHGNRITKLEVSAGD